MKDNHRYIVSNLIAIIGILIVVGYIAFHPSHLPTDLANTEIAP